ncbi:uncharacterized protein LOC116254946 [Nymphaea colorata]|nr:uncharacterized protein LOC116254946 [Nymphaea colorata]
MVVVAHYSQKKLISLISEPSFCYPSIFFHCLWCFLFCVLPRTHPFQYKSRLSLQAQTCSFVSTGLIICLEGFSLNMGSLMAGWSSPSVHPNKVRLERNRSNIKEEIENFWKTQREAEEAKSKEENCFRKTEIQQVNNDQITWEESIASSSSAWWTRSSWAYLNEPPKEDIKGRSYQYEAHLYVAKVATKEPLCAI